MKQLLLLLTLTSIPFAYSMKREEDGSKKRKANELNLEKQINVVCVEASIAARNFAVEQLLECADPETVQKTLGVLENTLKPVSQKSRNSEIKAAAKVAVKTAKKQAETASIIAAQMSIFDPTFSDQAEEKFRFYKQLYFNAIVNRKSVILTDKSINEEESSSSADEQD